ncbi:hypothetical protein [Paraburkholderia sp. HP33-1]|uniref:hypothetical protein n=1 Tax=Paraburkholderia sp. HP33-1 TaxID=2883243 RepID=UPI001F1A6E87|nr:hypothetical protein [Paraburkholderia sp. HP33-1]
MSPELSARLRADYPMIFTAPPIDDPDSPDVPPLPSAFEAWGFECGDGWYDLIDALCAMLQYATKNGAPQVVARQMKEKFGGLRFAAAGHNDEQEGMIELAEYMSGRVCEVCGNRGRVLRNGWIRTRCPDHEHV